MTKHLWTDETDTVIAENEQDADAVWEYFTGDTHDSGEYPWRQIPDDKLFSVMLDDELKPEYLPEGAVIRLLEDDEGYPFTVEVAAPASAWVNAKFSDGFVCSTEY